MIEFRSKWVRLAATVIFSGVIAMGCGDDEPAGTGGTGGTGGVGGMGGMGGGGTGGTPSVPEERVIVADGRTVRLLDVSGGTIVEVDTAEIPGAGLLAGHQIFNVIQQPGEQRVFVGSSNDCNSNDWCWGNGRVDRFTFTKTSVTYDGLAYEMNDAAFQADGISCAAGDEVATGYPGQEGECAPGGLAFSPDGTRFYIDDDDLDGVEIFSVNSSTNDLAFIDEGGNTSLHGLAMSPNGINLYNGARVFNVSGDIVVQVNDGPQGNETEVIPAGTGGAMTDLLVSTDNVNALAVYGLANSAAPTLIDNLTLMNNNTVRSQAHNADLSRFVVVGRNQVSTISFDGTDLTLEDEEIAMMPITNIENRDVSVAGDDGELAVVVYFTRDSMTNVVSGGGVVLYSINDADGALTEVDSDTYPGPGRVALTVMAE